MGFLDKLFGRKKEELEAQEERELSSLQPDIVPMTKTESVPASEQTEPTPVEPEPPAIPAEEEDEPPESTPPPVPPQRTWDDVTQRKLDRYFARLREIYPDGVISRLNTGHKKLAERGAQLRSQLEMEGELDAFFALGGFTYCRMTGGRPPLPLTEADCETMQTRIRQLFPEGVPVVMAVREADHRLYLDLRAVARREGKNVGEYLRENGLMDSREDIPSPSTPIVGD